MAKPTVEDVAGDLTNVLRIAKHFSYLWEKGAPLHGLDVTFTETFTAPDESWYMAVRRKNGQFSFKTRYDEGKLNSLEASRVLIQVGYVGDTGRLSDDFKASLMKPLGEYLAKKEMERVGQESHS